MATEFEKDTAKALVLSSGFNFDNDAFDETELTEDEKYEITKEIQKFCINGLRRLQKKYGEFDYTSTKCIVDAIIYEDENQPLIKEQLKN